MSAAGVVQALHDLALLVEGDGQAVGGRLRPQRAWQLGQLGLEPRLVLQEVGVALARGRQGHPEGAGAVALQVVRHARQVVGEQVVGAGLVALQPVALDAVAVGLVDQHEVLVLRQRHAVGEVQVLEQHFSLAAGRVEHHQAAIGAAFEQVEQVVRLLELAGGVGEIDAPVAGDIEVVGEGERHAVGRAGQHFDLAGRVDAQQALVGVGQDQVALCIEIHAQRAATGVGEGLDLAVGDAHHAAVMQAGIDPALGVHGSVFRAVDLPLGQQFGLHQAVVGLQHAGHQRCRLRLPGQRVDGAGGDGEVAGSTGNGNGQQTKEFLHCCSSLW